MTTVDAIAPTVPPLSVLTESEREIAESVHQFAVETIGPRSHAMDEANRIDPELVRQFFDLDLMGIEIPEEYGGLGQTFGTSIAVIEALARVDAACAVVVDVQNTLVNNAILRWASPGLKKKYLPQLAKSKVGAYALSEAESGSDAFALKTRAEKKGDRWVLNGGKLWITNGLEAELFLVFANVDFSKGYRGITAFLVEAGLEGLHEGEEGGEARNPRLLHARSRLRGPRGPRGERRRQGGRGLQDRHRDAERGAHRHRRADDRHRPRRSRLLGEVRPDARPVRQADLRLPGDPARAGPDGHGARVRPPRRLQRGAPEGSGPAVRDAKGPSRS